MHIRIAGLQHGCTLQRFGSVCWLHLAQDRQRPDLPHQEGRSEEVAGPLPVIGERMLVALPILYLSN